MKALSIIGIIWGSLNAFMGLFWTFSGETDIEMGLGIWLLLTAGYLLAISIVIFVKSNKSIK